MKTRKGIKGNQIPTQEEAWKVYNFINEWKNGTFGIMDLDTCLFGYYEKFKSK